jgi:hypothetical protein
MPQMENTCSPLEILDDDDGRADEVDDNKPIQVGTPRVEWAIGEFGVVKVAQFGLVKSEVFKKYLCSKKNSTIDRTLTTQGKQKYKTKSR